MKLTSLVPNKILLLTTLTTDILIYISSNSRFGAWICFFILKWLWFIFCLFGFVVLYHVFVVISLHVWLARAFFPCLWIIYCSKTRKEPFPIKQQNTTASDVLCSICYHCSSLSQYDISSRSSDLTPLDFFAWGHIKSQAYKDSQPCRV